MPVALSRPLPPPPVTTISNNIYGIAKRSHDEGSQGENGKGQEEVKNKGMASILTVQK